MVFVVGTGRSGTHFLTGCLISHPQITDLTGGKENPFVFENAVRLAAGTSKRGDGLSLVWKYRLLRLRAHDRVLVDQSHPNLWNYQLLSESFPAAVWLALVRDPRAVVASMLRHSGVRNRTEEWRSYPFPNPFIGLTWASRTEFERASLTGRCAYRWLSHAERTLELVRTGAVIPVSYERLVRDPESVVAELAREIGVDTPGRIDFAADTSSISKWERELTASQVDEILEIANKRMVLSDLRQILGEP